MRPQDVLVDPRFIVESADKSLGDDLDQILVAGLILSEQDQMPLPLVLVGLFVSQLARRRIDFAADDRLDPLLLALFIEIDRAEHHPMIGDRQAVHAQLFRPRDHILNARRPVQQTVFGMYM